MIWRKGAVVQMWRFPEAVWILKEENAGTIKQFRIISLLSDEGKIFFSVVAQCLMAFPLKNSFLNTSVQKRGVSKVLRVH